MCLKGKLAESSSIIFFLHIKKKKKAAATFPSHIFLSGVPLSDNLLSLSIGFALLDPRRYLRYKTQRGSSESFPTSSEVSCSFYHLPRTHFMACCLAKGLHHCLRLAAPADASDSYMRRKVNYCLVQSLINCFSSAICSFLSLYRTSPLADINPFTTPLGIVFQ